jgi:hypothetical protein
MQGSVVIFQSTKWVREQKCFGNTSLKSGKHAAVGEYNENVTYAWSEDYHIMQSLVTSLMIVLQPAVWKVLTSSLRKW